MGQGKLPVTGEGGMRCIVCETVATCLARGQSARYAPISRAVYVASRLDATYDHRKIGLIRGLPQQAVSW
jgi:hypothetical protein